jgi:hypothetical protein
VLLSTTESCKFFCFPPGLLCAPGTGRTGQTGLECFVIGCFPHNACKHLASCHRIGRYNRSVTGKQVFVRAFTSNSSSITPSWLVQPALCTYQNLIKHSGCTNFRGRKTIKEPTQVTLLLYLPILCSCADVVSASMID